MKDPGRRKAYEDLEPEFVLYEAIVDARIRNKLTQKQLGEKMGLRQSAIARFESGKISATLATLQKFCKVLGLKVKIVQA